MRALEFIRDHVTFKLPYDSSYHMKTTPRCIKNIVFESFDKVKKMGSGLAEFLCTLDSYHIVQKVYVSYGEYA